MYSIKKTQGKLDNLDIFLVGDLKYGRTVHSLIMAMAHFSPKFHFISPEELKMPEEYKIFCNKNKIPFTESCELEGNFDAADILYMTRVQKERFLDLVEYEQVKDIYTLRNAMLETTKPNLRILHPLPRVGEINPDVDANEKAYYFQQAQNGLYVRQAIISKALNLL
jgi:aspartate carbamoyltransferase catalytic subunit